MAGASPPGPERAARAWLDPPSPPYGPMQPMRDLDDAGEGVVLLAADGAVQEASAGACAVLGVEGTEGLRTMWPGIRPSVEPALADAHPDLDPVPLRLHVEATGCLVYADVHALSAGAGFVLLVRSAVRDREIDLALQLASRYLALSAISIGTTHAFRDSLNALTVNTELLARTLQPGSARPGDAHIQQRCLQSLGRETAHMAASIGRVLAETQYEPAVDRARSRVELVALVHAVIGLLRSTAEHRGVVVTVRTSTSAVEVVGCGDDLRVAVLCLATNALEAMPDGGRLTVTVRADGSACELTVSDTGPLVSPQLQRVLWRPYLSGRRARRVVGLCSARKVAIAHGGTLSHDPSTGETSFSLRLPVAR